jgi:hypothetical protein
MTFKIPLAGAALALALAGGANAADLKLTGLDGHAVTLSGADFAALPHVKLTVTVEGKTNTYAGVPLATLLAKVGAPQGPLLKGKELRDVVLVSASDGYAIVLALAETDPAERKDQILVADSADGAPLPATQAPYRLVVEGDMRGARLARMVTSIAVQRVGP